MVKYHYVIKPYDTERERYEADGEHCLSWYKAQIFAMIESEDDTKPTKNSTRAVLVQATDFESALRAIKTVMGRNEYTATYNAFKSMQELNIEEVFIPDNVVQYYSNEEIG
jgi:hypothetical protein